MKYIYKKQPIFLLIDNLLFHTLEGLIEKNNQIHTKGKFKLKLDFAVYLLDLISRKSAQKKSKYVRIKAEYLKDLQWNYNYYIDFLLRVKLLTRIPYSKDGGNCYGYKIVCPKPILTSKKRRNKKYEPLSFTFRKKLQKHFDSRKIKADKTTGHLTKWLNSDNISFDYESAIEYIHSVPLNNNQLYQRRYLCEMLREGIWYYSRQGKDNRLHSNITTLPWDLKPFISNNGAKLVYLDLKSSQPFILAGLLNLIVNKEYDKLDYIVNNMIVNKSRRNKMNSSMSIMIPKSFESTANKELREFVKLVAETDIYDYIGTQFSTDFLRQITTKSGYVDLFYNKELGRKVKTEFDSLRSYSKRTMLEYLYCSPKSSEKRYKELRNMFPDVLNELVDSLKETNIKLGYGKNDFAIILQNIEASIFLDAVGFEFSNKYPNTFIGTIHDSVLVPIEFEQKALSELRTNLKELFDLNPYIKPELITTNSFKNE